MIPRGYAVSDVPYNHPVNGADTCAPTGLETWGLTGITTDSFNYGFGQVSFVIGEYSSDFSGLSVGSISLSMCGYKNDTIADPNAVDIGIYSQADGSLRKLIGSVAFDSLPICKLNQDGTGGTCASQHPSAITVTGSYTMKDAHSPGGIDFIGVSFPAHSAVGHDVLVFCSNNCSNTVVSNGGICDLFGSSNKICHLAPSATDSPGSAIAGSLTLNLVPFGSASQLLDNAIVGGSSILLILTILAQIGLFIVATALVGMFFGLSLRIGIATILTFGIGLLIIVIFAVTILAVSGSFDPIFRAQGNLIRIDQYSQQPPL